MKIDGVIESIVKLLRARIITGELPSGQKLNEVELASELDVSRPSLREALRILEQKHLTVNVPRKGSYVAELSFDDFTALYLAREMMECYAIDLLEVSDKKELPDVEAAITPISNLTLPPENDPQQRLEYLQSLIDFHYRLVEACGNKHILHFYSTIASNIARYQFIYFYKLNLTDDSHEDHRKILDYIRLGEYSEAKAILRNHISRFSDLMCSLMTQETMKYPADYSQGDE